MINVSKVRFNQIYVPILIEQLFMMLMNQADVMMLSAYDTKAIAVSGISTQMMTVLTFLITIVHVGVSIRLVHQKEHEVHAIKSEVYHSVTLNIVLSIGVCIVAMMSYHWILLFMQVPSSIFDLTYQFGMIFLVGFTMTTTQMLVGSLLRILGLAHIAAMTTVGINIINVLLNGSILFIFTNWFESPILAVAIATLFSRFIGLIYGIYHLIKKYQPRLSYFKLKRYMSHKVIVLGLPGAGEQISYNVAQTIMTAFLIIMGTEVIAAKSLTVALSNLSFCVAMAYSLASQIYLGKFIARRKFNILSHHVYRGLRQNILRSVLIMSIVVIGFVIAGRYITSGEEVYHLTLFYLCLFVGLEPIRAMNNYMVDLLNVAGDVRYPVLINVVTTWCLLIPLSYLTAFTLGWGYIGMILMNMIEEGIRFILMMRRWQQGIWKSKLTQIGVRLDV
ncbi:MATE family efflux transporter [Staphylococcus felis]|uniref:MATE family efflux transporter n=1 Tax=Staphylococcus felis TaxID=46127 RepID=UPI0021D14267|nr:MATE family efflux transporter [Staphylococcus felis]UXR86824.1 MATE family efflux transporter [Staphylococcus felis]